MKKITTEQIKDLAREFEIDWKLIKTIILVESSNNGFNPDGKIVLRFEEKKFHDATGILVSNKHKNQTDEWEAFVKAYNIDSDQANLSTSFGMGQIMGNEFKKAGYDSVDKMIGEFKISEFYQVKGILNFCKNKKGLWAALKKKDWPTVAYLYNGPGYKMHTPPYHERLENTYSKL
jgi:hypothetical protein